MAHNENAVVEGYISKLERVEKGREILVLVEVLLHGSSKTDDSQCNETFGQQIGHRNDNTNGR